MASIDIDLNDFDWDDIVDHFLEIHDGHYEEQIKKRLSQAGYSLVKGQHESEPPRPIITMRDQQYEEVFTQLKEKFNVWDLQAILDGKWQEI